MDLQKRLDSLYPQMVETLKTLVRIKSVQSAPAPGAPYGQGAADCLAAALDISAKMGFKTHNMDGHVGWAEYGEGEEMVAVLGHLDVVPEGDGWTVCPPYAPVERDGRLYGRGSIDDKGPVVAALYALKALADEGFAPRRRIRVIFGCNEETGSADMKYYLAHGGEVPVTGFTPDGGYPLINGEKGIAIANYVRELHQQGDWRLLRLAGGSASNIVPAHASADVACPEDVSLLAGLDYPDKVRVTPTEEGLHIEAEGVSAHGSIPEKGENAIGRLCLFLRQLPLDPDAADAVRFVAEKIGMDTTGKAFGIDLRDELSGALSFNLGVAKSEPGPNGAASLSLTVNYRWPVTCHYADCAPKLTEAFAAGGWMLAAEHYEEALFQPADSPLVQTLLGVYRAHTGDASPALCIGGGTYAKAIPNILAFGPTFPGEVVREHEPDEFIDLANFKRNAAIYADAIKALAE